MTPEQSLKRALKDFIERHGGYWIAVTGGPWSKPGDPDMVAFFRDGRFIGIEAKTRDGVQSAIQFRRQREIENRGGVYLLVRSVEDLENGLRDRGITYD